MKNIQFSQLSYVLTFTTIYLKDTLPLMKDDFLFLEIQKKGQLFQANQTKIV